MKRVLDIKKIGNFVRSIRVNNQYQLNEFSELLRVSQKKIKKIEAGEELPNLLMVIKCCHLFDICADDFIIYVD